MELSLLLNIDQENDEPALSAIPAMTVEPLPSASASASVLDPFKLEIICILNIPVHLAGSADVSLQVAY